MPSSMILANMENRIWLLLPVSSGCDTPEQPPGTHLFHIDRLVKEFNAEAV